MFRFARRSLGLQTDLEAPGQGPDPSERHLGHEMLRFAVVGGLGTVTNLGLFLLLVDLGPLGPLTGAVISFAAAVTQNYFLNEYWAFARGRAPAASGRRYTGFVAVAMVSLAVNLAVLEALVARFSFTWLVVPQAAGIGCATAVNFVGSRWAVFR